MIRSLTTLACTGFVALSISQVAFAQCEVFDFEGSAPGTTATSLVPGVTITCPPNSCASEGGLILPEIYELIGGPDGINNVVTTRPGCPDFSPDYLRLDFDENQRYVEFRLGALGGSGVEIRVRWFNEFGTVLGTRFYTTASDMGLLVTIDDFPIRRVEIQNFSSLFESIDNLKFGEDETAPSVEITSPAFGSCICGDSSVGIMGSVDDADGSYGCDRAEYRRVDAGPSDPWILFGQECGAFTGTLHTWSTVGVPEGQYYVRITGMNSCGLSQSDVTVLRVDRSFDTVALPALPKSLCDIVVVEGTVEDVCGAAWVLEQRPVSGGAWALIDFGDTAVDGDLAAWDTTTVPDGDYQLRLTGTDECGHTANTTQVVVVDNSSVCGCSADLDGDGSVGFVDLILLLSQWGVL